MAVDRLSLIETHPLSRVASATPNLRLLRERQRRCWTQNEVADALYACCTQAEVTTHGVVNAKMVSTWERGRHRPSLFWQRKLCDLFGKTAAQLGLLPEGAVTMPAILTTDQHQVAVVDGCLTIVTQPDAATASRATGPPLSCDSCSLPICPSYLSMRSTVSCEAVLLLCV
jgi:transcriptional regulator with XRE-family HTH domain